MIKLIYRIIIIFFTGIILSCSLTETCEDDNTGMLTITNNTGFTVEITAVLVSQNQGVIRTVEDGQSTTIEKVAAGSQSFNWDKQGPGSENCPVESGTVTIQQCRETRVTIP